jgi:hypothetical protein
MLRVGFYIKLPQTTVAMTNGNNVAYNLTTWHGASDLSTMTSKEVRNLILESCLQDGPIVLRPANFNQGDADINMMAIRESIQAKILKLGFCQICLSILRSYALGTATSPTLSLSTSGRHLLAPTLSP